MGYREKVRKKPTVVVNPSNPSTPEADSGRFL